MSDISKVVFGNEVLIDLTQDTVNANNMLLGTTAHGANGEQIEGTLVTKTFYQADNETFDDAVEQAEEYDFIVNEEEGESGVIGAEKLNDLNDVSISTPSDGQVMKYNATTQKWENADIPNFVVTDTEPLTIPSNTFVFVYE